MKLNIKENIEYEQRMIEWYDEDIENRKNEIKEKYDNIHCYVLKNRVDRFNVIKYEMKRIEEQSLMLVERLISKDESIKKIEEYKKMEDTYKKLNKEV